MKFGLLAFFLMLIGTTAVLLWSTTAPVRPTESIKDQTFDFHSEKAGRTVSHDFLIANPTDRPVKVLAVDKNCSCTELSGVPEVIPANKSIAVTMKCDLADREGPFSATATLRCESLGDIKIRMRGNVVVPYPKVVAFGRVRRDQVVERAFGVRASSGRSVAIERVDSDSTLVKIERDSSDQLRVTLRSADIVPGEVATIVRLFTDDSDDPVKDVKVTAEILGEVYADPADIPVGLLKKGEEKEAAIHLRTPYGNNLRVATISAEPVDAIRCNLQKVDSNPDGLVIPVVVRGVFTGGVFKGVVNVETSDGTKSFVSRVTLYALEQR